MLEPSWSSINGIERQERASQIPPPLHHLGLRNTQEAELGSLEAAENIEIQWVLLTMRQRSDVARVRKGVFERKTP
jgi:hypothetical protein